MWGLNLNDSCQCVDNTCFLSTGCYAPPGYTFFAGNDADGNRVLPDPAIGYHNINDLVELPAPVPESSFRDNLLSSKCDEYMSQCPSFSSQGWLKWDLSSFKKEESLVVS